MQRDVIPRRACRSTKGTLPACTTCGALRIQTISSAHIDRDDNQAGRAPLYILSHFPCGRSYYSFLPIAIHNTYTFRIERTRGEEDTFFDYEEDVREAFRRLKEL